jgi:tripartite-type tricarboxylate transporter receptor subunit TctC
VSQNPADCASRLGTTTPNATGLVVSGGSPALAAGLTLGAPYNVDITGATRTALAPDLPTIAQTVPGYDYMLWQGIVAPAKTPPAIIAKLNTEVVKALNSPDVREQMAAQGMDAVGGTQESFAETVRADMARYRELMRAITL